VTAVVYAITTSLLWGSEVVMPPTLQGWHAAGCQLLPAHAAMALRAGKWPLLRINGQ